MSGHGSAADVVDAWQTGYAACDREAFLETLVDWGFHGPAEKRPAWLEGDDGR